MTTAAPERAAKWFRVSTGAQDEANQYGDVDAHCADRGYDVARTFTLHGDSAYHGRQEPELDEVLADIRAGKYSVVVVAHSSRLDRRDPDIQQFYALSVRLAGGRIESVREPDFGKATLSGRLLTMLAQEGNHKYSRDLSANVRAAHQRIDAGGAFRGRVPWGYAPVGEKYGKHLEPTEEGARLVPLIFDKIAAGESCAAVAAWLAEEGATPPTRHGKRDETNPDKRGQWWGKAVAEMVRRRVYTGLHEWERTTDDGTRVKVVHRCTRLVSDQLWQSANDRLASAPRRGPAASAPAMLRGVAVCGNCGGTMLRLDCGNRHKDGSRTVIYYYRCYGTPGPQRKGCGLMVRLDLADAAVDRIMLDVLRDEHVTRKVRVPGQRAELKALEYELSQLGQRGLSWDEEDAERQRLRAEHTRVSALGPTEDTWADETTDETYRDVWEAVPHGERGTWLAEHKFTVWLTKDWVSLAEQWGPPWDDRPRLTHYPANPILPGRVRHAVRLRPDS